jgi:hypothetical protein
MKLEGRYEVQNEQKSCKSAKRKETNKKSGALVVGHGHFFFSLSLLKIGQAAALNLIVGHRPQHISLYD